MENNDNQQNQQLVGNEGQQQEGQQVQATPQQLARQAVEEKYQRLYGNQPNNPNLVVATEGIDVAVSTNTQTPTVVGSSNEELVSLIKSMKDEITALKSQQSPKPQEQVTPTSSAATTTKTPWIDKIREGDLEGAEAALAETLRARLFEEAKTAATREALESFRVQQEVEKYLGQVRAANQDLIVFEKYLEAPVARRLEQARAQGKITSADDFLREYKSALDAEVSELRNLSLKYRAEGKQEAQVRSREVLSSQPLNPQEVKPQNATTSNESKTESIEDYFTRRRKEDAVRRGLLPRS